MLAKELRGVRWPLCVGAVVMLIAAVGVPYSYEAYQRLAPAAREIGFARVPPASDYETYLWAFWFQAENGKVVLTLLAAILGASLLAGEVSRGTIFLLLTRPISRERVLLAKYGTSALGLLALAGGGTAALALASAARGYPLPVTGLLISTVLLWLSTLGMLGVALLCSLLLRDTVKAVAASVAAFVLLFVVPEFIPASWEWNLVTLSANLDAFRGDAFPARELAVCLLAAALPLLAALALFRRQQY